MYKKVEFLYTLLLICTKIRRFCTYKYLLVCSDCNIAKKNPAFTFCYFLLPQIKTG